MKKTIILTTLILLFPLIASAVTLEEYVNNLDTSYYDGTINITSFTDQLTDTNNNNINDTLIFTLTTDYATEGNYTAELIFTDESVPVLSQTKIISSTSPSFNLNISTYYLKEPKYLYYARIYNPIGQIVYESKKVNTSTLTDYETGTNITSITDQNINNDFLRITLGLDITRNETVNISVNLKYNDSIISATKEATLTTPSQSVQLQIDNETLKSTHYTGTYNITSIIIENKIIETEYTTNEYNYEDFAKTSYIKSYADGLIDTNNNNFSDLLEINFTINIITAGTYNLESELRDLEGNFIALINHTESLSTGTQILTTYLNGSEIYKTHTNGPYTLNYAKLSLNNNQKDITYNAYTTDEIYYSEFERPLLPDLQIYVSRIFDQDKSIVEVNITNIGSIPAFNIFLDIFDNGTYENQSSWNYLNASNSVTYNYIIYNSNATIITAIVDFDNIIDESDETNNIGPKSLFCVDADNDGYNTTEECGIIDCDDENADIYPGTYETCNNLDDNCNNLIDEDLKRQCGFSDIGICSFGFEACSYGSWTDCTAVFPENESCNNLDDDCNDLVDDTFDVGLGCSVGTGECKAEGQKICSEDGLTTICNAAPQEPSLEICDNKDNNCNGIIDENCTNITYSPRQKKQRAITLLEDLKDNLECKSRFFCQDREIEKIIKHIQKSLNPAYFIDDQTLNPEKGRNNGRYVFLFEKKAALRCFRAKKGLKDVCNNVTIYLKAADKEFAEKALEEAESAIVINPENQECYERETKKSHKFLLNAENRISQKFPTISINFYLVSWKFSQKAIKYAASEKKVCREGWLF